MRTAQRTPMWTLSIFWLFLLFSYCQGTSSEEELTLYYYGIEESERGLRACESKQACAVHLQRYWRGGALLRLCRCPRRRRCDTRAPPHATVELNNRAHFQFCQPVTDWPQCSAGEQALTVETTHDRISPEDLEELHHRNIQLVPPKVTFNCQCRAPNYWRLKSVVDDHNGVRSYQCGSLPLCRTGELCGHVTSDLFALYQSCLCPKHHICVHKGGVPHNFISELLFNGSGWKAYCERVGDIDSYEDY